MEPSKSTDKMLALKAIIDDMPKERTKSFKLVWEEVDGMVVPFVHAEFYEEQRDANDW